MHEKRYSGDIARLRSPARRELLEVDRAVNLALEGIHPASVLDVGMGSGLFTEMFAGHGLSVSGIDANPEMVTAASQWVPTGTFKEAAAEEIPFSDGSFDLVFMGLVWHETDDRSKALLEARRITRMRIAILEWPYEQGVVGPPLADRIDPKDVEKYALIAGFTGVDSVRLTHTVMYRMEIK